MKRLYAVRAEHPGATIILANDRKPYWRERYMANWYNERGLEPVIYKGNRGRSEWLFRTTPAEMEQLYSLLLEHGAASIGAVVVQDPGLEADDVWGLLASTYNGQVLGITTDSDWSQLVSDRVRVENLATGELQPWCDIRAKWVGGDSGDGIPGCPRTKKDGNPAAKNWGQTSAAKLLESADWQSQLDAAYLERNRVLTTLPCPLWDLEQAETALVDCATPYERTDVHWDRYGVTAPVRKMLDDRSQREQWVQKLRLHLLQSKLTTTGGSHE
jgi:hypothetical protein